MKNTRSIEDEIYNDIQQQIQTSHKDDWDLQSFLREGLMDPMDKQVFLLLLLTLFTFHGRLIKQPTGRASYDVSFQQVLNIDP